MNLQSGIAGSDLFRPLGGNGGLLGVVGSEFCFFKEGYRELETNDGGLSYTFLDDLHTGDFSIQILWHVW